MRLCCYQIGQTPYTAVSVATEDVCIGRTGWVAGRIVILHGLQNLIVTEAVVDGFGDETSRDIDVCFTDDLLVAGVSLNPNKGANGVVRKRKLTLDSQQQKLVAKHPDQELFRSLPGAGDSPVPRLIAAFGSDREKYIHVCSASAELQRDRSDHQTKREVAAREQTYRLSGIPAANVSRVR